MSPRGTEWALDCGCGAIDGYGSAAAKEKKSHLTLAAVRSIERAHRTGQYSSESWWSFD